MRCVNTKVLLFISLIMIVLIIAVILLVPYEISDKTINYGTDALSPFPKRTPFIRSNAEKEIHISASHDSGYYPKGFNLELYCNAENYQILYTITSPSSFESTNGLGTKTSENYIYSGCKRPLISDLEKEDGCKTYEYFNAIEIPDAPYSGKDPIRITIIRAIAIYNDETVSDCVTFTYIVGNKYSNLYGGYLVNISIDEDDLYDFETGIFVKGKNMNYTKRGVEWERRAKIQIFDREGNVVVDEDAGIRVNGGASRHFSIKSLKVNFKDIYGSSKIEYDLFKNLTDKYENKITKFDSLILRNSGNDLDGLMFKDVFLHKLASSIGIDYQDGVSCSVYINGKYYSLMNMRESLDGDYIESHYNIPKETIAMISVSYEPNDKFYYKSTYGAEEYADSFKRDMLKIISTDYKDKDITEIDNIIDIDNFIKYMAYQIYIGNLDWPHNNILAWKYIGVPNESVSCMDSKWRFILKDLDFRKTFVNYEHNTLETALNNKMSKGEPTLGEVLLSCLKNKEFEIKFKKELFKLCDDITQEKVNNILLVLKKEREKDIIIFWNYRKGNESKWDYRINELKDFVFNRAKYVKGFLGEFNEVR